MSSGSQNTGIFGAITRRIFGPTPLDDSESEADAGPEETSELQGMLRAVKQAKGHREFYPPWDSLRNGLTKE